MIIYQPALIRGSQLELTITIVKCSLERLSVDACAKFFNHRQALRLLLS